MIIKSVELVNIRSHKHTKIEFGEGINVLIGNTGAGKSSILIAIEFALFGKDCRREFSEILNRRANAGYVILEFEHNGKNYKIVRGLVREGKSIRTDNMRLKIYENGKLLYSGGRAQEMNKKIREILGFPKNVNPIDLFEILFYSKQDEIRKIIEMSKEERQNYIDRALMLEKYRKTYENLKEIIDELKRDFERLKFEVLREEDYKKEIEELKKKKEEEITEKEEIEKEILETEKEIEEIRKKIEELRKQREIFEKEKEKIISEAKRKEVLEKEREKILGRIEELKRKITPVEFDESEYEELLKRREEIEREIYYLKREKERIEKEIRKMESLREKSVCPMCKQKISKEHLEKIIGNLKGERDKIIEKLILREEEFEKISREIKELEKRKRIFEENKIIYDKILELEERATSLLEEIERINIDEEYLKEIERKYDVTKEKERNLFNEYSRISGKLGELKGKLERLEKEITEIDKRISEIEKKLSEIEEKKSTLKKLEKAIEKLEIMREEIKKIREVVRIKFLEDFRREFSRWFREIRREEYYSVDIDNNYEPKIYTPEGFEMSIKNLSGGEKTSLALAYRLALSSIVSKLGGMSSPNLLILDEPTTGLDEEDIKTLPEILRKIGLRQIIIVTHSRELKEAGDIKFYVKKEKGVSTVERIEDL